MSAISFDASQVAPAVPNEAIPAGWYQGYMSASVMKPTNDGTGAYLEAEYVVLAPAEYAGRKVYDRMNLQNKNPVAVEIAYRTLSAVCHATGVIQIQDSAQLHNRPLQIKVGVRAATTADKSPDGKAHDASNEIKGYKAVNGAAVASNTPALEPVSVPSAAPPAPQWAPPAASMPQPTPAVQPAPQWTPPAPAPSTLVPAWAAQPVPATPAPVAPPSAAPAPVATPPWATNPAHQQG